MKRILVISLIILVLLIAGGALGVRQYLRSPRVANQVTARLEALYGGPVRVESVDVGLAGSSVSGFELFEEGGDAKAGTPWLKVGSLAVDVSLWDLVRSEAMPKNVTVKDAHMLLRFDDSGRLVTRFPAVATTGKKEPLDLNSVPDVTIETSEVTFRKQGQADLVAKNVNAKLTRDTGKLSIAGTADSAELGKLAFSGNMAPTAHEAAVTLKTEHKAHVTAALLNRLPFIPSDAFNDVRIVEGDTPAELTVRYDLNEGAFHYRLELAPENTTVAVPRLALTAHEAHGRLIIDDDLVQLRDTQGKAYGGTVKIDADLDFRGMVNTLNFSKIQFKDLNVSDLGEEWHIPARALFPNGKLSGTASLEMTMGPQTLAPAAVDALVGLAASASGSGPWLPAVTVLAAFPHREVQARSTGEATISDPKSGSSADIEMKLAPRRARPPAPKVSWVAPNEDSALIVLAATMALVQPVGAAYPEINIKLENAGNVVLSGVNTLLRDVVAVGSRFVGGLPQRVEPPVPNPGAGTTYLDLNLKLKNVDLAQFVKGLKLKLDFPIDGRISIQVKASIPTDQVGDLTLYKVKGQAQATDLVLAGVKLGDLTTDVDYAGGVLALSRLQGRLGVPPAGADPKAGTFAGNVKMQVVPLGEMSADLTFDRLALSELSGMAGSSVPIGGTFSGQLAARVPAGNIKDLKAADGMGKITGTGLSAYGLKLDDFSTSIQLKGGVLRLPDVAGRFEGTPITAVAELHLSDSFPFSARMGIKNWDIAALAKLAGQGIATPVALAGSFSTTVDVKGALEPMQFTASGDATTAGLKVNGFQVSTAQFHWDTDAKRLNLRKIDLQLYGGHATGSAVLPLGADVAGSVDMKVSKLDTRAVVKDLALPFKLEGQVDGQIKATLPAAPKGQARTAAFDLDLTAPKLRLENIPTEQVRGKLDYKAGVIDYKLEGKSLGGTFDVDGQIPSAKPANKESGKGKLRIRNVSLTLLAEALGMQDTVPLRGRLNLNLDYRHPPGGGMPDGKGRLHIDDLRWQGTDLATDLSGQLTLEKGVLRLRQISGEIAQGTFRAALAYDFGHPDRGRFYLALDGVESSEILSAWLGDKIKGPMQARIRGTLGATWQGTAELELARGEVFGLIVNDWRLPADWHYAPSSGRAKVEVAATSANVARGRVIGKVNLSYDNNLRLDGNVQFLGADLQSLLRPFMGSTQLGAGQVTGRFDFAGTDVRSFGDLTGTIAASFKQAQPLQMPILSAVTPFIRMGPSTTFQRGTVKARLDRGVLRVQQLALVGGTLMLHVDGTVTLGGQLNLNVIAKTSDVGLPTLRLGAIGARLPLVGPAPLALVRQAADVLANRVIYLDVRGTVHNPTIRVQPLRTLSQEALRFFVTPSNTPVGLDP